MVIIIGNQIHLLDRHNAEVIGVHFNSDGNLLLTGSFDHTAHIWDLRSKT